MADLESGSTIGGRLIIHQGIANRHNHDVEDFNDKGDAIFLDEGEGNGLDADVLSGLDYEEMENQFIRVDGGGTLDTIQIDEYPQNDNDAATYEYLKDRSEDFLESLYHVTKLYEELTIEKVRNYEIRIESAEFYFDGFWVKVEEELFDVRNIINIFYDRLFYIYVYQRDIDDVVFEVSTIDYKNSEAHLKVASFETDQNGVVQNIQRIDKNNLTGVKGFTKTTERSPRSLVTTDESGKINESLLPSKHSAFSNITGDRFITPNLDYEFQISNYSSFSKYSVEVNYGDVTLDGDVLFYEGDVENPDIDEIVFTITRDSYTNDVSVPILNDGFIYGG